MNAISDAPAALRALLEPDETVLWSAQPRQGLRLRPSDMYLVPASLVLFVFCIGSTGIAAYAFVAAVRHDDRFEWPFLLMFVLVGLAFCAAAYRFAIGRFFVEAALRARTYYALSNKRAFIVTEGPNGAVAHVRIGRDADCVVSADDDGYANLRLSNGEIVQNGCTDQAAPDTIEFLDAPRLDEAQNVIDRIKGGRT